MEKEERKQKKILTDNHMVTVKDRETSLEGLSAKLEAGEDGIYHFISDNNKNILFTKKKKISQADIDSIPFLKQLSDSISALEKYQKTTDVQKYLIKRTLIEMRKDQYLIKAAYNPRIQFQKITHFTKAPMLFEDKSYYDKEHKTIIIDGISLMDYKIVSAILEQYSRLKSSSYDNFRDDTWFLLLSLEAVIDDTFTEDSYYRRIIEYKVDGLSALEIKQKIQEEYGITHTEQYISSLWKNKIPRMIAETAQRQFLIWYFKQYKLPMKCCNKCGKRLPLHKMFFSTNGKDKFYSICKKCRNKRAVKK